MKNRLKASEWAKGVTKSSREERWKKLLFTGCSFAYADLSKLLEATESGIHMYILLNPPGRVRDPFGYGNKKKEEEGYLYPSEGRSKTVTDPL